ncbi:glutaminase A [Hoyosella sp. YIM 151337]|uniref:glutaminase A n=1 Tax=Hoyosella sp. YIM 151337 TaxID=2992742 RepID=UPI002235B6A1|nr:glutaminase A [Hoyosella sp. YIM 151337]MCW4353797.1 glutaminase A [Hoyosella sp. YIM 151337]
MKSPVPDYLDEILDTYRSDTSGELNSELPDADADCLAIAITSVDGVTYSAGDADERFPIESMSKPFTYALAMHDVGTDAVHEKIGVEPSGDAFNEISLESSTGRPFNAMINAGAIAAHCLVDGDGCDERAERIRGHFSELADHDLEFEEAAAEPPHRNLAIGHMLRTVDMIDDDPEDVVRGYTRQCALAVTTRDVSIMASVFANRGIHPVTGAHLLEPSSVRHVLSVMATCGMYDAAGDWMTSVGIPAKSGISGGIMGVLPGQVGIAVFSPRVDSRGNSVRGVELFEHLSRDMGLHLMETPPFGQSLFRRAEIRDGAHYYELQGAVQFAGVEALAREVENRDQAELPVVFDLLSVTGFSDVSQRLLGDVVRRLREDDDVPVAVVDPDEVFREHVPAGAAAPTIVRSLDDAYDAL